MATLTRSIRHIQLSGPVGDLMVRVLSHYNPVSIHFRGIFPSTIAHRTCYLPANISNSFPALKHTIVDHCPLSSTLSAHFWTSHIWKNIIPKGLHTLLIVCSFPTPETLIQKWNLSLKLFSRKMLNLLIVDGLFASVKSNYFSGNLLSPLHWTSLWYLRGLFNHVILFNKEGVKQNLLQWVVVLVNLDRAQLHWQIAFACCIASPLHDEIS